MVISWCLHCNIVFPICFCSSSVIIGPIAVLPGSIFLLVGILLLASRPLLPFSSINSALCPKTAYELGVSSIQWIEVTWRYAAQQNTLNASTLTFQSELMMVRMTAMFITRWSIFCLNSLLSIPWVSICPLGNPLCPGGMGWSSSIWAIDLRMKERWALRHRFQINSGWYNLGAGTLIYFHGDDLFSSKWSPLKTLSKLFLIWYVMGWLWWW